MGSRDSDPPPTSSSAASSAPSSRPVSFVGNSGDINHNSPALHRDDAAPAAAPAHPAHPPAPPPPLDFANNNPAPATAAPPAAPPAVPPAATNFIHLNNNHLYLNPIHDHYQYLVINTAYSGGDSSGAESDSNTASTITMGTATPSTSHSTASTVTCQWPCTPLSTRDMDSDLDGISETSTYQSPARLLPPPSLPLQRRYSDSLRAGKLRLKQSLKRGKLAPATAGQPTAEPLQLQPIQPPPPPVPPPPAKKKSGGISAAARQRASGRAGGGGAGGAGGRGGAGEDPMMSRPRRIGSNKKKKDSVKSPVPQQQQQQQPPAFGAQPGQPAAQGKAQKLAEHMELQQQQQQLLDQLAVPPFLWTADAEFT